LQGKVLKKLEKKYGDDLDEARVAELLQQLLANSRWVLQELHQQQLRSSGASLPQHLHFI
jgi:uncharacterized protein (DUF697 family)